MSVQRTVISHPHIMNWNGGIIEKRLNSDSTFLWQDQILVNGIPFTIA